MLLAPGRADDACPDTNMSALAQLMTVRYVRNANRATPTGDPSFVVQQSMPGPVSEEEADPFLMCDEFGPTVSQGAHGTDSDGGFTVPWHPHHGMEILSYMISGRGRHADSLGNREVFRAPGFQWLSVGSGIEHAEGGGTPAGESERGLQIWLRMPAARMRDAPRYGTVGPEQIPVETIDRNGSFARVIAGRYRLKRGPARFAVNVQILDIELKPDTEFLYERPPHMDNVMFYCLDGGGRLNGANTLYQRQICRFDTTTGKVKVSVSASSGGMRFMVFAGVSLKEPLTWHGPFVCADRGQLEEVFRQHQAGAFPPVRVPWDYKDASAAPART